MTPLFSTIIPVYNRVHLITATLDSVLVQEFKGQEVIVVDDGSTDGTPEIVEARYGERVKVLRQQNRGPGVARNLGAQEGRGEYLAFLDSDDLWFPWTLALCERIIRAERGPAYITGCHRYFTTPSQVESISQTADSWRRNADLFETAERTVFIGSGAAVIRRDAFLQVGGFTDLRINSEDNDLAMRLGTAGGFVQVLSPPTLACRQHGGNLTRVWPQTIEGSRYLIRQEIAGNYPGGAARRRERRQILSHCIRPVVIACGAGENATRRAGWELYRATFFWHLGLGRLRFLIAFPVVAMLTRLRSLLRRSPSL